MKYCKLGLYTVLYCFTVVIVISSFFLKQHQIDSPIMTVVRIVIVFFATVLLTKYTVYMFLCPWHSIIDSRERRLVNRFVKNYRPLVSVLIPAWNEEVGLSTTIKSLLASTYTNMEIVVVNDGSTDESHIMMLRFLEKYHRAMEGARDPIRIVYHYKENGGKGSALNTAIALSKGDILLSIDADCFVKETTVKAFVEAFRNPEVMAAVGNVKVGNTRTVVGTIQHLEYNFGFYFKKADSLLNTIYIIGGAAGAFRREVFQKLGGYSVKNITEDIELSVRIQQQGWRIVYCPDALVYTEGASSVYGLMKQRLRWKRGRFQTFWEHRKLFFSVRPEHNKLLTWIVLPLAVFGDVQLGFEPLFIIALYVFSLLSNDFSAFLSGIFVVSLMFGIQGWESRKEQSRTVMLLAPIGWCLFYLCTFVELYSLVQSVWLSARKKEVKWQRWQRKGVADGK